MKIRPDIFDPETRIGWVEHPNWAELLKELREIMVPEMVMLLSGGPCASVFKSEATSVFPILMDCPEFIGDRPNYYKMSRRT